VYETLTPEQRIERARNAAAASHSIKATAEKLVRDLPTATPEQQRLVLAVLEPLLQPVVRGSNG
jgi:hypothetical protein